MDPTYACCGDAPTQSYTSIPHPRRPPTLQLPPTSTDLRLVLPIRGSLLSDGCCAAQGTFVGTAIDAIPEPLRRRGVRESEWADALAKLDAAARQRPGCPLLTLAGVPAFLCGLVCLLTLAERRFQRAMGGWLHELNDTVLESRGMYARFQSFDGGKNGPKFTWLAIALTAEEADRLRVEPSCWQPKCCQPSVGVPADCKCCITLCWCGARVV